MPGPWIPGDSSVSWAGSSGNSPRAFPRSVRIEVDERVGEADLDSCFASKDQFSQHVLLGVETRAPARRVIHGPEDIMNVHEDAGLQPRQHVEEEYRDVRVHEKDMRSIEREDIARLQLIEDRKINVLENAANDRYRKFR